MAACRAPQAVVRGGTHRTGCFVVSANSGDSRKSLSMMASCRCVTTCDARRPAWLILLEPRSPVWREGAAPVPIRQVLWGRLSYRWGHEQKKGLTAGVPS